MPRTFRFLRAPVGVANATPPARRTAWILAMAVLLSALAATYSAWHEADQRLAAFQQTEFDYAARQTVRRIEQRMAIYEQVERSTQAFLLGSMEVDEGNFRLFVQSLRLDENFPGIQGVALSKLLAPSEVAAHVAGMQKTHPALRSPSRRPTRGLFVDHAHRAVQRPEPARAGLRHAHRAKPARRDGARARYRQGGRLGQSAPDPGGWQRRAGRSRHVSARLPARHAGGDARAAPREPDRLGRCAVPHGRPDE